MQIDSYFEQFKRGEEIALDYYIQKYIQKLSFFALKLTKNQEASEEIVCDTFFKLWQDRSKIETDSHLYSFLFRVTKNACLNHLQKNKSLPVFESDYEGVEYADEQDIQYSIIYAEFIEMLYKELDKLPEQQGRVFKMSYLEGCSTAEICETLNTTASTVFYAKSKALQSLRKTFKDRDFFLYLVFTWLF